jgi:hypothetical protein
MRCALQICSSVCCKVNTQPATRNYKLSLEFFYPLKM